MSFSKDKSRSFTNSVPLRLSNGGDGSTSPTRSVSPRLDSAPNSPSMARSTSRLLSSTSSASSSSPRPEANYSQALRASIKPPVLESRSNCTIMMAGESGVGKTSFCHSIKNNFSAFSEQTRKTELGETACVKEIPFTIEGKKYSLAVTMWDTAGQEKYASALKLVFRRAHVVIFMYDCTDKSSVHRIADKWLPEYNANRDDMGGRTFIIVGNKIDKAYINNKRQDTVDRAQSYVPPSSVVQILKGSIPSLQESDILEVSCHVGYAIYRAWISAVYKGISATRAGPHTDNPDFILEVQRVRTHMVSELVLRRARSNVVPYLDLIYGSEKDRALAKQKFDAAQSDIPGEVETPSEEQSKADMQLYDKKNVDLTSIVPSCTNSAQNGSSMQQKQAATSWFSSWCVIL